MAAADLSHRQSGGKSDAAPRFRPLISRSHVPSVHCRPVQQPTVAERLCSPSLRGAVSGSGSKHSGYKIKQECIKAMLGACLLNVGTITKHSKERAGSKSGIKSSSLPHLPTPFVSFQHHSHLVFPCPRFLAHLELITSQV